MIQHYVTDQQKNEIYEQSNAMVFTKIIWANRLALATCFLWFGFLKLIHASPAEPLVTSLHDVTIVRYIPIQTFMFLLGIVECTIGILWLIPGVTKLAFTLFALQMFTTFLPLFYLPHDVWQTTGVLTLPGQYIVKNVVFLSSAATVFYVFLKQKK